MEYARGGELFNKISTEGKLSEAEAKPLFFQVASAVQHLVSASLFMMMYFNSRILRVSFIK